MKIEVRLEEGDLDEPEQGKRVLSMCTRGGDSVLILKGVLQYIYIYIYEPFIISVIVINDVTNKLIV